VFNLHQRQRFVEPLAENMATFHPTTLERAFALARTGDYPGVPELRAQLGAEGYALRQLEGPSLIRQLRELCTASSTAKQA